MQARERLATAPDGTRLAWWSAGRGAPAVVLTDGIGCAGFVWRHIEPALARRCRVVHWNYRGHGRSARPLDPARVTIEDCVADLLAVMDAAGIRRAVLAGHSMGVQVSLEAHRRAPERVLGLALVCGAPGRAIDAFHDGPYLRAAFPLARAAVERWPELARVAFRAVVPTPFALRYAMAFEVNARLVPRQDIVRYLDDLAAVDPTLFVRMLASAAEHDASDHLGSVDVPTIVVAGERDAFTPVSLSVKMHEAIAGSELLVVPGGTHVGPLERPRLVTPRLARWVQAQFQRRRPGRRTRRSAAHPR